MGGILSTVVANDFCIGCGVCVLVSGGALEMRMDAYGKYQPFAITDPKEEAMRAALAVCPFSNEAVNEDFLASQQFPRATHEHSVLGRFEAIYAGHVSEAAFRREGSSGGFGSWVLYELLRRGLADYVVHVRPNISASGTDNLFQYTISSSAEHVRDGAKSKYYPIELSSVLSELRSRAGRYIIVGLPCFIKAVRLLCRQDEAIRERVAYTVSLLCGHLKSSRYLDMMARDMRVRPDSVTGFVMPQRECPNS
jgi:coenzyme F420 hydrogenase subunit beta